MATRAFDAITILSALETLDHEIQTTRWQTKNPAQRELFAWLSAYKGQLARITGLEAKASPVLRGAERLSCKQGVQSEDCPFDSDDSLGIVSLLDKLVRWRNGPGMRSSIATHRGGDAWVRTAR